MKGGQVKSYIGGKPICPAKAGHLRKCVVGQLTVKSFICQTLNIDVLGENTRRRREDLGPVEVLISIVLKIVFAFSNHRFFYNTLFVRLNIF